MEKLLRALGVECASPADDPYDAVRRAAEHVMRTAPDIKVGDLAAVLLTMRATALRRGISWSAVEDAAFEIALNARPSDAAKAPVGEDAPDDSAGLQDRPTKSDRIVAHLYYDPAFAAGPILTPDGRQACDAGPANVGNPHYWPTVDWDPELHRVCDTCLEVARSWLRNPKFDPERLYQFSLIWDGEGVDHVDEPPEIEELLELESAPRDPDSFDADLRLRHEAPIESRIFLWEPTGSVLSYVRGHLSTDTPMLERIKSRLGDSLRRPVSHGYRYEVWLTPEMGRAILEGFEPDRQGPAAVWESLNEIRGHVERASPPGEGSRVRAHLQAVPLGD